MNFCKNDFESQILWQCTSIDALLVCIVSIFLKTNKYGFNGVFMDCTEDVVCTEYFAWVVYIRHGHKHAKAENKMEEQLYNETNFHFESVSCVLNHAIITILAKAAVDIVKIISTPFLLFNQFWNHADWVECQRWAIKEYWVCSRVHSIYLEIRWITRMVSSTLSSVCF